MSGIVGVLHLDGRAVDASILDRLSAASRHRAVDGADVWIDGSIGLAHQYSRVTPESREEKQPFISSGLAVSFDGRLDNRRELLDMCAAPPETPDAALVLAVHERAGDAFLSRLNGDFALALFDAGRQRLTLACDVMGARSLYYSRVQDTVVFASEMKAILAHPLIEVRPDQDSLADIVLNGDRDPHRTLFESIFAVPPGFAVIATPDGIEHHRFWDFDAREIRYPRFAGYVEHFRSVLDQSIRRRVRSVHPIAVSVSGGLDSSSILCGAARQMEGAQEPIRVRGFSMTFPPGTAADEREYLDAIASSSPVRIETVSRSSLRLMLDSSDLMDRLEMPRTLWDAQVDLFEKARQAGCRVLLDGFFGDQLLSGQTYLIDLLRRGRWMEVRRHLREAQAWMTDVAPHVLRREFGATLLRSWGPPVWLRRSIGRVRRKRRYPRWFTASFAERAVARATGRIVRRRRFGSMHADQCYRTVTSSAYLIQAHHRRDAGLLHELEVAFPFRDRDLAAFIMAIPGEIVNWRGVPKGLLRHAFAGVLPERIRVRRSKGDFTRLSNDAVLAARQQIEELLSPDSLCVQLGFVDASVLPSELPGLLRDLQRDDDATAGWQLTDVAALEVWLRHFIGSARRG